MFLILASPTLLHPTDEIQFLNTSLNFLLGISPDDTSSEAPCTSDEFVDAFHDALFLTMVRMILGPVWKLLPQGRFLRVCNTAHSFLNHYIAQAIGQTGASDSGLAQSKKRSLVQDLSLQSDDQGFIRSQVLQGMMASQETTSSLLGNAFFLLSRHPSYWDQVRNEVLAKGDMSDFDTLLNSKVLQNILLESKYLQVPELTATD
jgi:cytochrome P450